MNKKDNKEWVMTSNKYFPLYNGVDCIYYILG